jgi:hypothetical protein
MEIDRSCDALFPDPLKQFSMKGLFSLVIALSVLACRSDRQGSIEHLSQLLDTHRLTVVDSLMFRNRSEVFVGQVRDICAWRDKILISDMFANAVWVFDDSLRFLRKLGQKGKGPGEFATAPHILSEEKRVWFVDKALHRVSCFDSNLSYVGQRTLPKGYYFEPNGVRLERYFLFLGGFDRVLDSPEHLRALPPYVLLDSNLRMVSRLGQWDQRYFDSDWESYARNLKDADFAPIPSGGFFAHQRATYRILEYDADFNLKAAFGLSPKHWRDPPKISYQQTQSSIAALSDFIGSSTTYWGIGFDSENHHVVVNYANLNKDYFFKRTLLAGKHYLQIYDRTYDCIADAEVRGKLAFVKSGKIYVLSEERPEYIKLLSYRVVPR